MPLAITPIVDRQRPAMRRAVDPARQARDHDEPRFGQGRGEIARQLDRRRRGVARADHRRRTAGATSSVAP